MLIIFHYENTEEPNRTVRTWTHDTFGVCTDQKPSGCWAAVDTTCFLLFLPLVRRAAASPDQRS